MSCSNAGTFLLYLAAMIVASTVRKNGGPCSSPAFLSISLHSFFHASATIFYSLVRIFYSLEDSSTRTKCTNHRRIYDYPIYSCTHVSGPAFLLRMFPASNCLAGSLTLLRAADRLRYQPGPGPKTSSPRLGRTPPWTATSVRSCTSDR